MISKRYGVATTISFPLITAASQDFKTGATVAAGDFKITKDEGTYANTATTTPTEIATSSGVYKLALSATEMQAARISVLCKDAAGAEWEATVIEIETYGHPSSEHPSIGIPVLNGLIAGTPTTTVVDLGTNAPAGDDRLNGGTTLYPDDNEARLVDDYNGTSGEVTQRATLAAATAGEPWYWFPTPPASLTTLPDVGTVTDLATQAKTDVEDSVWDAARASHVAASSFGEGVASVQGAVTGAVGSVTGAVGSVTGAVGSVAGNVDGNVTGSVGSVVGAVGSVTGAVGSVTGAVGSVAGNVDGNVTGSVASVVGAVGSVAGNVDGTVASVVTKTGYTLTTAGYEAAADALLGRNVIGGSNTGRTVSEAIERLRNRVAIAAGTMTVYAEDDTTPSWTAAVTTAAGNPISDVNPA